MHLRRLLNKKLNIGYTSTSSSTTPRSGTTHTTALQDLANGRIDAAITSVTTAQGYIDAGNPVKIVGDPVFYEPLSVGFDRSSSSSAESLFEVVDKIVGEMHADGTLTEFSEKWYGSDLTKKKE